MGIALLELRPPLPYPPTLLPKCWQPGRRCKCFLWGIWPEYKERLQDSEVEGPLIKKITNKTPQKPSRLPDGKARCWQGRHSLLTFQQLFRTHALVWARGQGWLALRKPSKLNDRPKQTERCRLEETETTMWKLFLKTIYVSNYVYLGEDCTYTNMCIQIHT